MRMKNVKQIRLSRSEDEKTRCHSGANAGHQTLNVAWFIVYNIGTFFMGTSNTYRFVVFTMALSLPIIGHCVLAFFRNVYRLTRLNQRDAHIDMLYKCEFAALLLTLSIAISLFRPLRCRPMRHEPKMMFDGIDVTMQCDCKICIRLLIWIRKVFCTTQTKNSNEPNRDRNTTQNTVFTDGNFLVCGHCQ